MFHLRFDSRLIQLEALLRVEKLGQHGHRVILGASLQRVRWLLTEKTNVQLIIHSLNQTHH